MRWQIKCLIDNSKTLIPFQHAMRKLKRRMVPYHPSLARGAYAISERLLHIRWLRDILGTLEGKTVLEIGSGWELLIPMLFSLCHAERVYLSDLTALLDKATLAGSLETFRANKQPILDVLGMDSLDFDSRFSGGINSEEEFLSRHRFIYLAPCDCRSLSLESSSLDVVTSRSVMEHIPPPVIEGIFQESYRLLRPGGVACHFVDNSDHWEHGDKNISRVNFLKYSDRMFRLTYLNSLNYQNRLRHSQYIDMLRRAGFEILRAEPIVDARALKVLDTLPLAPAFRRFSAEDLATTDSYLLVLKR
jgi:SAM-dependent methyltransferase